MEHKTSRTKESMEERLNEKSDLVHIEECNPSDATLFPLYGFF